MMHSVIKTFLIITLNVNNLEDEEDEALLEIVHSLLDVECI
jgi:hypothetical protein